jgi:hypothetical protein
LSPRKACAITCRAWLPKCALSGESSKGSSVGRKGCHLVVFRMADGQAIDVIRLLHDSIDLAKHLPD